MPDSKADVLSNAIKEATEDAQKSIEAYGKLAEQAATQLTGDAPVDNAAWARLTAKAFSQAAGDVARSWNFYNEVLRVLANGGQPSTPEPDTKPDG